MGTDSANIRHELRVGDTSDYISINGRENAQEIKSAVFRDRNDPNPTGFRIKKDGEAEFNNIKTVGMIAKNTQAEGGVYDSITANNGTFTGAVYANTGSFANAELYKINLRNIINMAGRVAYGFHMPYAFDLEIRGTYTGQQIINALDSAFGQYKGFLGVYGAATYFKASGSIHTSSTGPGDTLEGFYTVNYVQWGIDGYQTYNNGWYINGQKSGGVLNLIALSGNLSRSFTVNLLLF